MHTVRYDTVLTARVSFLSFIITPSAAQQASACGLSWVWLNSDVAPIYILDQLNASCATRRATSWTRPLFIISASYMGALRPARDEDSPEWVDWSLLGLDNRRRGNWRVVTAHFKNPSKPTHGLQVIERNGSNSKRTVLTSPSSSFVVLHVLSEVNHGESFIWRTFLRNSPSKKIRPVRLNVFNIVILLI